MSPRSLRSHCRPSDELKGQSGCCLRVERVNPFPAKKQDTFAFANVVTLGVKKMVSGQDDNSESDDGVRRSKLAWGMANHDVGRDLSRVNG